MNTADAEAMLTRLSREWLPGEAPALDQETFEGGSTIQRLYREDGYVVLRNFIPFWMIDEYVEEWQRENGDRPMGWPGVVPYMDNPALRQICCYSVLGGIIEMLLGEPGGVHLNLTGWRSTQRNWHQDGYLNPDTNKDHYVAAWIALDDISGDAGPFEFVPGSHRRYGAIRHETMLSALSAEERSSDRWPWHSERLLTPMFEALLSRDHIIPTRFLPRKGDVLLWHPRLLHRGTEPRNPDLERRALIAHFSGIEHRVDMPPAVPEGGGWYFPIIEASA